jgi:2-amino-4-hydroxy-6-hydroxymethyldihydropteridine diphosphokinase
MVGKEIELVMNELNGHKNMLAPEEGASLIRCAIGIGSNLDEPAVNVINAIDALCSVGELTAVSSLYRTAPWGFTDQPDFCNAVALINVSVSARELLGQLKRIERDLGRFETVKWGPRVIDLDLLIFGDQVIDEEDLIVPHPEIFNRAFVLYPLSEVLPFYLRYLVNIDDDERAQVHSWIGDSLVAAIPTDSESLDLRNIGLNAEQDLTQELFEPVRLSIERN